MALAHRGGRARHREHSGPKLLVRYEDLRAEPIETLGTIADWLGLEPSASALAAVVDANAFERLPRSATGSTSFARAATPGLWRRSLRPEEQAVVHEVLGSKLEKLGYAR